MNVAVHYRRTRGWARAELLSVFPARHRGFLLVNGTDRHIIYVIVFECIIYIAIYIDKEGIFCPVLSAG